MGENSSIEWTDHTFFFKQWGEWREAESREPRARLRMSASANVPPAGCSMAVSGVSFRK